MPRVAASIKKPIHNVKEAGRSRKYRTLDRSRPDFVSSSLEYLGADHRGTPQVLIANRSAAKSGGAYRDRTDDLKLAKLALSQLS